MPPLGGEPPPLSVLQSFGRGLVWRGSAEATAEGAAADLGIAGAETVATGEVVAAGATLGDGALVLAPEALAVATDVGISAAGVATADSAVVVVGTTVVEGALVTTGEVLLTGGLLTPFGWAVIGVIVVGVAVGATVYVLMSQEPLPPATAGSTHGVGKGSMAPAPRHAPGAPGGAPVSDPRRAPGALARRGRLGPCAGPGRHDHATDQRSRHLG